MRTKSFCRNAIKIRIQVFYLHFDAIVVSFTLLFCHFWRLQISANCESSISLPPLFFPVSMQLTRLHQICALFIRTWNEKQSQTKLEQRGRVEQWIKTNAHKMEIAIIEKKETAAIVRLFWDVVGVSTWLFAPHFTSCGPRCTAVTLNAAAAAAALCMWFLFS